MASIIESRKMSTNQVAALLGILPQQVYRYRKWGTGPEYLKVGSRIIYEAEAVERWLEKTRRTRTSSPQSRPEARPLRSSSAA